MIISKTKKEQKPTPQAKLPTAIPTEGFAASAPGSAVLKTWCGGWFRSRAVLGFEAGVTGTLRRAQSKGGLGEPWSDTGNGYLMACAYLLNEECEIKLPQVAETHLEAHRDGVSWQALRYLAAIALTKAPKG